MTEPNDAFYIPSGDGQVRVAEPNELHLNNLQLCIDSGLGSVYQLGWFGVHVPSYSYVANLKDPKKLYLESANITIYVT